MDINESITLGSSKYRREQLKNGIDELKNSMKISNVDNDSLSQLQTLHFACKYILKSNMMKHLLNTELIENNIYDNEAGIQIFKNLLDSQIDLAHSLFGFLTILTKDGTLIYVSENVYEYLKLKPIEVLLSCDKLYEILHSNDEDKIREIFENDANKDLEHEIFCTWHTSKIKRKVHSKSDVKVIKMKGQFIANGELFVAICTPMLRSENRDIVATISPNCFTLVCSLDLRITEMCGKCEHFLGYDSLVEPMSLYNLLDTNDVELMRRRHKNLLNTKSKKGKTDPIKILTQHGYYLNCLINMYYGDSNYILCKVQVMTESEMVNYKDYVSTIFDSTKETDHQSECSATSPVNLNSIKDENDDLSCSSKQTNIDMKRKYVDQSQTYTCLYNPQYFEQQQTYASSEATIKRQRIDYEQTSSEPYSTPSPSSYESSTSYPASPISAFNDITDSLKDYNFYYNNQIMPTYTKPIEQLDYNMPQYTQIETNYFDDFYEKLSCLPEFSVDNKMLNHHMYNPDSDLLDDIMSIIQSENTNTQFYCF